jgi:hypothetical protein
MVAKAREDFPEPDSHVITVRVFLGIFTFIFFKLCVLAPRTSRNFDIKKA